ncbi:putative disease resistance protein RGA4 [Salvia hispanica]|uniref:putative disease resistance protein RGA4 n=1 Tax=Salvia hispanica TaxID=49212 RepID=UPI0020094532|nr:putative disease resistance protein RGA4 [Salvia hispanica]
MVLEALEPHPNLESLYIKGYSGRYIPGWMESSTLRKIVKINMSDCENIRCFPKLGELPHLEKLYLKNMGVEYIIEEEVGSGHPVKIQFPALKELHLTNLPNLKGLSKEHESKEAFPNLETLLIERCYSLDIPRCLSLEFEKSLTCFPIETLAKFSKLRTLTMTGVKEISVTREGLQALKELTRLNLYSCQTMRSLPEGMLRHLTALNILLIVNCREFVELPEDIKHLHNLEFLLLHDLPKMTRLPQAFQQLISLYLIDLPELESLPDQLPSLNSLYVIHCPKVMSIPALPNLKRLSIIACPQLGRRCQKGSGEDWHKIAHVRSIDISPN